MCFAIGVWPRRFGALMAGDALPLVEDLDRLAGKAHVDEFADQAERRGIPVASTSTW